MRTIAAIFFGALVILTPLFPAGAEDGQSLLIKTDSLWIKGVPGQVTVTVPADPAGAVSECALECGGRTFFAPCSAGAEVVFDNPSFASSGRHSIKVSAGPYRAEQGVRVIHGLVTLLPPLVAIGLALAFRQVLAALFISVWLGAFIFYEWNPIAAFARSVDAYIIPAMADYDQAAMLIFIIFMGGLIGMIAKSGGIQGIVDIIARRATSARSGQVSTFIMGMFVFFDDYANTIIVGTTMRPITDRLKISREKLSYIVDSTAAPLASIVPVSTWIGYEVGLIGSALEGIGADENAYMLFLESVLFRFYPIFALALVFIVAMTGRDFGPMARAEKRAREESKPLRDGAIPMASLDQRDMSPPEGKPRRWYNAIVPLAAMVAITFVGLWAHGKASLGPAGYAEVIEKSGQFGGLWMGIYVLGQVYSEASANIVLAWSSLAGCVIAAVMIVGQRILGLGECMQAWLRGVEGMVIAVVVLLLAWSLGAVMKDLHTAEYLTISLSGALSPKLLPALTFLIASGISFATGTSYGTMAILIPLAIPVANRLGLDAGLIAGGPELHLVLVGVVSSVLAGAVFGDHCSPISDTTIMSSMASSADHVDHVKTQLPYALLAGGLGILIGDIPTAYGLSPLVSIVLGLGAMVGFLYLFGKRAGDGAAGEDQT